MLTRCLTCNEQYDATTPREMIDWGIKHMFQTGHNEKGFWFDDLYDNWTEVK